ncbi:hypothetical protein AAC387_Pa03g3950 [Persea americana]
MWLGEAGRWRIRRNGDRRAWGHLRRRMEDCLGGRGGGRRVEGRGDGGGLEEEMRKKAGLAGSGKGGDGGQGPANPRVVRVGEGGRSSGGPADIDHSVVFSK